VHLVSSDLPHPTFVATVTKLVAQHVLLFSQGENSRLKLSSRFDYAPRKRSSAVTEVTFIRENRTMYFQQDR
jgi:hypothetical protein